MPNHTDLNVSPRSKMVLLTENMYKSLQQDQKSGKSKLSDVCERERAKVKNKIKPHSQLRNKSGNSRKKKKTNKNKKKKLKSFKKTLKKKVKSKKLRDVSLTHPKHWGPQERRMRPEDPKSSTIFHKPRDDKILKGVKSSVLGESTKTGEQRMKGVTLPWKDVPTKTDDDDERKLVQLLLGEGKKTF